VKGGAIPLQAALILDPPFNIVEHDLWQFALCHLVQVFNVDCLIQFHLLTSGGMAFLAYYRSRGNETHGC
jgi:hypothetical protein